MIQHTEQRIQQSAYMWIHNNYPHLRGLYFEIHNNAFSAQSGMRHKAIGRIAGVADNALLLPNSKGIIFFEFKAEGGKQSPEQKAWQAKVQEAGYYYYLIYTETEFRAVVISHCGPRGT